MPTSNELVATPVTTPVAQPTVLLAPSKSVVSSQGCVMEVLVRVQALDWPEGLIQRGTHKRLALVVDRSGSMHGDPLTEALACVVHIAERLTPTDQMALVVYDAKVDTLLPLCSMGAPKTVADAVAQVQSGGTTNLFGGWEGGAFQLEGGSAGSISRVILLSDGQANEGLCDEEAIARHCGQWLAKGVSTTTVGLGRGFNENLMSAMARAGGGQQYYGQTAADLFDSFDEEFSLLQALCLRGLDVRFVPAAGVIIEPVGLVRKSADGSFRLSDLAWGAEAWMVLRLHISPGSLGAVRDLLAVSLSAHTLQGESIAPVTSMLSLPVVSEAEHVALPLDELVQRRTLELEFAQASQELRDLIKDGDLDAVVRLMAKLKRRFGHHPWLADKLEHMQVLSERDAEMFSKEVYFSAMKMSTRLSAKQEMHYSMDETLNAGPAFLRKKVEEGKGRVRGVAGNGAK
ncbi:MAG: VWA domain-containing protein [Rhodoferax sp.]|nr:VWA domain-containing protein [Rhodoferax sp.]